MALNSLLAALSKASTCVRFSVTLALSASVSSGVVAGLLAAGFNIETPRSINGSLCAILAHHQLRFDTAAQNHLNWQLLLLHCDLL